MALYWVLMVRKRPEGGTGVVDQWWRTRLNIACTLYRDPTETLVSQSTPRQYLEHP
jgi:hypothetical protein